MKRKKIILAIVAVAAVLGGLAGAYLYRLTSSNCVVREGYVCVPTDAGYAQLLDSLGGDGALLKSIDSFKSAAKVLGLEEQGPKAGRYAIRKGMSYKDVVRVFQRGYQTPTKLVFNNARTLPVLAGRIAAQIEPDSLELLGVFTDKGIAEEFGFDSQTFIAMFIPNTYEVYWNVTPRELLKRMKGEYDRFWEGERTTKLQKLGMTRVEAMTLASIVYEETKMTDEMPVVAGVYVNRLKKGMPLQACPTVRFALNDFTITRVLIKHTKVESPYNTYQNAGLPPGPIAMPSIKAIDAVLNYMEHDYVYFCARADLSGYHNFAVTLSQHNKNRRNYTKALDARGIK